MRNKKQYVYWKEIGKKCFFDKGSPWHSFILFSFVSYVMLLES